MTSCETLSWGSGEERDGNQQGLFLAISLVRPLDGTAQTGPPEGSLSQGSMELLASQERAFTVHCCE